MAKAAPGAEAPRDASRGQVDSPAVRTPIRRTRAAPALERRTITLEEWAMFIAALDHYVAHYGNRSGVEDEALARAMLKSPLRLTVEDA